MCKWYTVKPQYNKPRYNKTLYSKKLGLIKV